MPETPMTEPTPSPQGRPILVALDLSSDGFPVFAHACRLAARLSQPLAVVHVAHETADTVGLYRRQRAQLDTTPMLDLARAMLEERIDAFRGDCADMKGVGDVQILVVDGIPQTRIPELAGLLGADLIVMGRRHRGGLARLLHSSVSSDVGRRAPCPVVIVDEDAPAAHLSCRPAGRAAAAVSAGL